MHRSRCEKIEFLLSKYADNEATLAEREQVSAHIAECENCARQLAEYEQVAAIFRSEPTRTPDPQLRVGLYREINRLKEEDRRLEREARENRTWHAPARTPQGRARGRGRTFGKLWSTASPFVIATMAIFAFMGISLYINRSPSNTLNTRDGHEPPVALVPVPTLAAPVVAMDSTGSQSDGENITGIPNPPPVSTKAIPATFLPSMVSATALPSDGTTGLLDLISATPVQEAGDPTDKRNWNVVRDGEYGYSISYPPNWWTQAEAGVRYFRPWSAGGTTDMPYWVEMRVENNQKGLTVSTAAKTLSGGKVWTEGNAQKGTLRLRHNYTDSKASYDELYSFSAGLIYTLRLIVPTSSIVDAFAARWTEGQAAFSKMSGMISMGRQATAPTNGSNGTTPGSDPVLFLYGPDLWMVDAVTHETHAITHGGFVVRQFTLSPDMRTVAFTSAKNPGDVWANSLYIAHVDGSGDETPTLLWANTDELHDIAWYNNREILAIGKARNSSYGVFRIDMPAGGEAFDISKHLTRLADLGDNMAGAKGLAVSPDRQLITFMAPLGESMGTDIYGLRPDGLDLRVVVSHTTPLSPSTADGRVLSPSGQAIKSYVWTDGHLEYNGYKFNMLFTCGSSASPTLYRGGFLYTAPGSERGVMLDNATLRDRADRGMPDPTKMQIVHMAYSSRGRIAMTGYYNDRVAGRADQLAGLWTGDVVNGAITNLHSQPIPAAPHGITDLQWAPDGHSLIYRETMPQSPESLSARYDGSHNDPFSIVKLDPASSGITVLYTSAPR